MESCGASEAKVMVVHDHGRAVEFVLIKSVTFQISLDPLQTVNPTASVLRDDLGWPFAALSRT